MEQDAVLHLFGTAPGVLLLVGQVHSTMDNSLSSGEEFNMCNQTKESRRQFILLATDDELLPVNATEP